MINKQILQNLFLSIILPVICVQLDLSAQDTIDYNQLEKYAEQFSVKERAMIYLQYSSELIDRNISNALHYNKKAFDISKKYRLENELAISYYNFGLIYRAQSNNVDAVKNFEWSLEVYKRLNDLLGQVRCYNNIGIIYKNMGKLKLSMEYYLMTLEIAEKAGYNEGTVDAISNISVIYLQEENYEQAIIYLKKSYKLQKNDEDRYTIFNNLGIANEKLGRYNEALKYYSKSLDICVKNSEYKKQAIPLSNIGGIYLIQGAYDKALVRFKKVIKIEKRYNQKKDLIVSYTNISIAYRMLKDYETALFYLNKAESIANEFSANSVLLKIYLNYALTYEEYGKYVLSLDYLYRYIKLNKKVYNIEKNKQIQELLAQFEADYKEKEIALLKKDNKLRKIELRNKQSDLEKQKLLRELETKNNENRILMLQNQNKIESEKKKREIDYLTKVAELQNAKYEKKQAELKQKNTLKNIAVVTAVFFIFSAIVLIFLYQQKLRTMELLNQKTEEINKQKIYELLRDQEITSIKSNIEGQNKERKRIAQDLHDGIGGNLASIKLNLASIIKSTKDEKLKKVMKHIDDTYNEVRAISHNLLPAKIMNEAFTMSIQNFINEISENKLLDIKFIVFPEKELNLLPDEIKIEIYRIIQELLNNIVKHSKAKSVEIQLIMQDKYVSLMVEDNGIGFDTNNHSQGIGLSNIRSRISAMKGKVSIESLFGKWTLVNIELPIKKYKYNHFI